MLKVFDGNAHFRRLLEADRTGMPARTFLAEIQGTQGVPVVVWDGKGGNARRRALYPEYKAKRQKPAEDIWQWMNMMKQVLCHSRALQIEVGGYEGDDCIAYLAATYSPQCPVEIVTVDRDLHALCALPGVRVVGTADLKVPANLIRLYKATRGDPSDNIPGIKGFGEKAWENCDKDNLLLWYQVPSAVTVKDVDVVAEHFNMPKSCASWLIENEKLARTFWDIVGFFPPTKAEVEANTVVGVSNHRLANQMLAGFMQ